MTTITTFQPLDFGLTASGIAPETQQQGVMLALVPPVALAKRIVIPTGDPVEQLHVTLVYFGNLGDVDQQQITTLSNKLPWIAANLPQIGLGFNRIDRLGDKNAVVLMADQDSNAALKRWRELLTTFLRDYITWSDTFAFLPHLTLGYWPLDSDDAPKVGPYHENVSWVADSMIFKVGPAVTRYSFDNSTRSAEAPLIFSAEPPPFNPARRRAASLLSRFESAEEFVNHNHTATRAHPNAGAAHSLEGDLSALSPASRAAVQAQLAKLPEDVVRVLAKGGVKVVGRAKVTATDKSQLDYGGLFMPGTRTVLISDRGINDESTRAAQQSAPIVLHELGHAFDKVLGDPSQHEAFNALWKDANPVKGSYYQKPFGGTNPRKEMFAEAAAHVWNGTEPKDFTLTPHLRQIVNELRHNINTGQAFSVEEFYNHNHSHADGKFTSGPESGGGVGKRIEFDPQKGAMGDFIVKSVGAGKAAQAILEHPEYSKQVAAFLDKPIAEFEEHTTGPSGVNSMPWILRDAHDWASDSGFEYHTVGEMLVAARLNHMISNEEIDSVGLKHGALKGPELESYIDKTVGYKDFGAYKFQDMLTHNNTGGEGGAPIIAKALDNLRNASPTDMVSRDFREFEPRPADELIAAMQDSWAHSVTNSTSSLALLSTVAKMRGEPMIQAELARVSTGPGTEATITVARAGVIPTSMGEYLSYGEEQAIRKELASGVPYEAIAYGIHKASVDDFASRGIGPEDVVHVYRGIQTSKGLSLKGLDSIQEITATMNPLSSWSTSQVTARGFGKNIMSHDVAVKDVFATSATGFGSQAEHEIVTYGGTRIVKYVRLTFSGSLPPSVNPEDFATAVGPLEFYNHAHDAKGKFTTTGGEGQHLVSAYDLKDVIHGLSSQMQASMVKSVGAATAGAAIRANPKHAAAVKDFLDQPVRLGLAVGAISDVRFTADITIGPRTIGEDLVLHRIYENSMPNIKAYPLDTGSARGKVDETYMRSGVDGSAIQQAMYRWEDKGEGGISRTAPKTYDELIANLRANGMERYIPHAEDELVSSVQQSWANSVTSDPVSVALLRTVARERGVDKDLPSVWPEVWSKAANELDANGKVYSALAYGIHTASENYLADRGFKPDDNVRIYRSMYLEGGSELTRSLEMGKPIDVTVTMNPLSSWSTDRGITRMFGTTTFRADIPVKDIFATSATGFGALDEFEVVSYGGHPIKMVALLRREGAVPYVFPEDFSVERPLEFVNHNHTPTSAHPNAGGPSLDRFAGAPAMPTWKGAKINDRVPPETYKWAMKVFNTKLSNGAHTEVDSIGYTHVNGGKIGIVVSGSFYLRNDNHIDGNIGSFARNFDGKGGVEHELLDISPVWQGQSMAFEFNQHAEEAYIHYGIREIRLTAASTVGGYAWAAAGYDWETGKVEPQIAAQIKGIGAGQQLVRGYVTLKGTALGQPGIAPKLLTPEVRNEFKGLSDRIERGEYVAPYEIAQAGKSVRIQVGESDSRSTLWAGKALMLGQTWYAVKRLDVTPKVSVNTPSAQASDRARLTAIMSKVG